MSKEFSRTRRLGEQIRRELSELVRSELKDPRLAMVSFTAVKLSRDLSHAVIYCIFMEDDTREPCLEALNNAAGYLRHQLAMRIRARTVPALKFVYDESIERGAYLSALIEKARSTDSDRRAADNAQSITGNDAE